MRILFVTEDLANGGSERVVSVLANTLCKENEVGIVAIRHDRIVYPIDSAISYFPFLHENTGKVSRTAGRLSLLRGTIRDFKPDVVIAFDVIPIVYAYICSRFMPTKLVVSERADPAKHKRTGFVGKTYFKAFSKADGAVFQTPDAMSFFDKELRERGTVIPNPVNESFARDIYAGKRTKEIVTACRLTNQKNLKLFIDIVHDVHGKYPEYRGVIYGEGPELGALQAYAASIDADAYVSFAGYTDHLAEDIYKSRFYLCTSDYEGISNSMLEAMSLGLTVLSTDCPVGGARMAITPNTDGMLFPVGRKEEAVQAMCELIADEKKADGLGARAAEIKERWSVAAISQKWMDYLSRIVDHGSR